VAYTHQATTVVHGGDCLYVHNTSQHRLWATCIFLRWGGRYTCLQLGRGMGTRGAVFAHAYAFNGVISKWDVSSVKNMNSSASPPGPLSPSCLCLPSCFAITHGHHDGGVWGLMPCPPGHRGGDMWEPPASM
jgi:hypothetical protein